MRKPLIFTICTCIFINALLCSQVIRLFIQSMCVCVCVCQQCNERRKNESSNSNYKAHRVQTNRCICTLIHRKYVCVEIKYAFFCWNSKSSQVGKSAHGSLCILNGRSTLNFPLLSISYETQCFRGSLTVMQYGAWKRIECVLLVLVVVVAVGVVVVCVGAVAWN